MNRILYLLFLHSAGAFMTPSIPYFAKYQIDERCGPLDMNSFVCSSAYRCSFLTSSSSSSSSSSSKCRVLMNPSSIHDRSKSTANNNENLVKSPEFICLPPGSILQIRIGDPADSRKAWKKRRRSGSPILTPCSILGMDRINSIRYNLMYLVQKYGRTLDDKYGGGKGGAKGIALKVKNVVKLWEKEFGSSLVQHASQLGYEGIGPLLLSLYHSDEKSNPKKNNKQISPTNATIQNQGICILKTESNLILYIPTMSIRRGRITAASTSSFLQMASASPSHDDTNHDTNDQNNNGNNAMAQTENILHTGYVRQTLEQDRFITDLLPLSAALRVPNANALSRIQEHQIVSAYVFQYDPTGDNGSPLLVLTLDPPRNPIQLNMNNKKKVDAQFMLQKNKMRDMATKVDCLLDDLHAGDGPFHGKIVKMSAHSGAAFVDIGVGRKRGKSRGGGVEKILGMLRFDNIVNDMMEQSVTDDETVEDVSDLYQLDDDGNTLFAVDPESGERTFLGSVDDDMDHDKMEEDDNDNDFFTGMNAQERLLAIGNMMEDDVKTNVDKIMQDGASFVATMKNGDPIDVYISSIFPQSRRFMVSLTKPSQTTKNLDIKHQKVAQKRLSKLTEGDVLRKVEELVGRECNGVVRAVSKTGDWFYVAPEVAKEQNLPQVGVAHRVQDLDMDYSNITAGTIVKVRLEGIKNGQLSMSLIGGCED